MKKEITENLPPDEIPDDSQPEQGAGQSTEQPKTPSPEEVLQAKLEEAQRSAESFKDQFLRKAAEFENYRRRTEAEFLQLVRNANEELLYALIPILEDFARSFKAGSDPGEGFAKGMELIYQKFAKVLEQQGLVPFESMGKPFDVGFHDALLQVPRGDVPPGTVVKEVERGYMLHDRVLRHAKVIVSAALADGSDSQAGRADSDDTREAAQA
jgi:molecular chaperone GrpE